MIKKESFLNLALLWKNNSNFNILHIFSPILNYYIKITLCKQLSYLILMTDSEVCSKFYMIKTLNSGQISYGSMSLLFIFTESL